MNTSDRQPVSILTTLAGLAALALAMPWWLNANTSWGLAGALLGGTVVPVLLIWAVYRRARNWSGITALIMIPYAVIGIMEVVATLGALNSGMALAIIDHRKLSARRYCENNCP